MKIGYPCINRTVGFSSCRTFRLASYSEEKLKEIVKSNLDGLYEILKFNVERNLLFFRISSDLVPFASHPINQFNWQEYFEKDFKNIGNFIKSNNIRISMHPDQFVLLHSPRENVVESSVRELEYHADILDLLGLDSSHKLQIHIGGAYGDKEGSKKKFIEKHKSLPEKITQRLVIENDDRIYSVKDCLDINNEIGIPILFDNFHHELNNNGEQMLVAVKQCFASWRERDGIPMVDYSSQDNDEGKRSGKHTEHIDIENFNNYLKEMNGLDFDIMLEIKDKELSAVEAVKYL
jgi:UV DNA damage endonuclease